MPSAASLFAHWYLHLPSLLLAALIYLLLARLLLSFMVGAATSIMRLLDGITNPTLAFLANLWFGRPLLPFIVSAGNVVLRVLGPVTHPAVVAVGAITPRIVPPRGVIVAAIVWLAAARVAAFWVALAMGMRL